jgi:hypothetical protein
MNQFERNHQILQQWIDQANTKKKKILIGNYLFRDNIHVFRRIIVVEQCLLKRYIMNQNHDLIVDFV